MKTIGIIYNGATAQAKLNLEHAQALGTALSDRYKTRYYNFSRLKDIEQLITDKKHKRLDLVFNNSAGKRGGDGSVEGMLDILGIPYVGSHMLATAVNFDKKFTKIIVANAGVPIVEDLTVGKVHLEEDTALVLKRIERILKYPLVVKASGGSDSIGMSLVRQRKQLLAALRTALKQDQKVIVEKFVKRKTEITCMVFGNGKKVTAFTPIEFVYEGDLLDEAYKMNGNFISQVPKLKPSAMKKIQDYAVLAHRAVGCSDYSRSDFLIDTTDSIYFLEINAHAGLGFKSPTVFSAKVTKGWDHKTLIHKIMDLAMRRNHLV